MLYRLLRAMARVAVRWYYREVEVVGTGQLPASEPVILAANHSNALVDALVVGTSIAREVRLTAKATLLDNPLTRVIVHAVGIIPLRRAADEAAKTGRTDSARNQGAFDLVVRTLARNGVVLIFPEGRSHSEPALMPLRTGCARMALQAVKAGVPVVHVVPVGLTFEDKGRPRSRVLMEVGTPIAVRAADADAEDAVDTLTGRLAAALRRVTLNTPSPEDAERVWGVARHLSRAMDDSRPLGSADTPLAEIVPMARQVERVRGALPSLAPALGARVDDVVGRLDRLQEEARTLGVPLEDLTMETATGAGAWFVVREALIGVATLPLALWGRLTHWVPMRLAVTLGRATSRNPDEPAMHTLVSGLVIVLAFYALSTWLVSRQAGLAWGAAFLASLPFANSIDLWLADRMRRGMRRARGYLAMRRHPERAATLVRERTQLRHDVNQLAEDLSPGE